VTYDEVVKKGVTQTCDDLAILWELICNENDILLNTMVTGLDGVDCSVDELVLTQLENYREKRGL